MHRPSCRLHFVLSVLTVLTVAGVRLPSACADPVVKLHGEGVLDIADDGSAVFFVVGQGSHLGQFYCFGEVTFVPGEEAGSLIGNGVAAFQAANGDFLVGVVIWEIAPSGEGVVAIPWRDSVTFSDGTTVESTGRFVDDRPAGAQIGHGGRDADGSLSWAQIGHGG